MSTYWHHVISYEKQKSPFFSPLDNRRIVEFSGHIFGPTKLRVYQEESLNKKEDGYSEVKSTKINHMGSLQVLNTKPKRLPSCLNNKSVPIGVIN